MHHHLFKTNPVNKYRVAVLCKQNTFDQARMQQNYIKPLTVGGVMMEDCIAFTLKYDDAKKVKAATVKEYSDQLLQALKKIESEYLYVTDGTYFKHLAGVKKTEAYLGYVLPCAVPGYEHMKVVYGINYQQLVFAPDKKAHLTQGLTALNDHINGTYADPGDGVIHSESYPDDLLSIKNALFELHKFPFLSCDIEAFGLKIEDAGIGTIQFAWTQHDFVAFKVDLQELLVPDEKFYSKRVDNPERRALLKEFLETYKGTLRYHSATFDIKHLIYNLWMKDPLDYEGCLTGLDVMTRDIDCTKVISYLATNSCAGNHLGLKYQAQEFSGNYAVEEITDIRKIPVKELLRYNGVDGLSTNYVYDKHYPTVVNDQQLELYQGLMKDSIRLIINIELVGMPMYPDKVQEKSAELIKLRDQYLKEVQNHPTILAYNKVLQEKEMIKANAKLVKKVHPIEHFAGFVFNPGSPLQLQGLLYETMGLPIIAVTPTKQPATGAKIIERLLDHVNAVPYLDVLKLIVDWSKVDKIVSAFVPAFKAGLLKEDGMQYLHGSFNIGGTLSGRLSSSEPNMQQIPSGSKYGKLVKSMFGAPKGWIFAGADFSALEDRINALLTKDINKLKIYTDGYDSHSYRTFAYWPEKVPGIVDTVESINSIAKLYGGLRGKSKNPTFLLTFGGTHHGLMKNIGFSKAEAIKIEENYHKLYAMSDKWVADRITEAARVGYATVAFGLRVRAPLLAKSILGTKTTPYESAAEARTLGNAMSGQSYGLLNNRAMVAFMKIVHASPYRYDIKPVSLIHDAGYVIFRSDPKIAEFVNHHLTHEMSWQELPEIQHDQVKLGAELDLFFPDWSNPVTIPNTASADDIKALCKTHKEKLAA